MLDVVVAGRWQHPATTMSNILSRMQNQRPLVQSRAPDDGRCVARNTLSFIQTWNKKFWYTVASCWLFLYEYFYSLFNNPNNSFLLLQCIQNFVPKKNNALHLSMDISVSTFVQQLYCTVRKHKLLRHQCCWYVAACNPKLCFRYFWL
jgi:hypothetical protein